MSVFDIAWFIVKVWLALILLVAVLGVVAGVANALAQMSDDATQALARLSQALGRSRAAQWNRRFWRPFGVLGRAVPGWALWLTYVLALTLLILHA